MSYVQLLFYFCCDPQTTVLPSGGFHRNGGEVRGGGGDERLRQPRRPPRWERVCQGRSETAGEAEEGLMPLAASLEVPRARPCP